MPRHRTISLAVAIAWLLLAAATGSAQNRPPAESPLEEARRLEQQVGELFEKEQFAEAIKLARRALAIREQLLPADHPEVAETLNDLGVLYQQTGNLAEARPLLIRALAIREKALKPGDPLIVETLTNLAAVYRADNDYPNAGPLLQRVLAINERAFGAAHREVATALNSLAMLYMESGDYQRAEPLFVRALAIREKVFGPEHAATAQSLNNLAALYRNQGEYARAESLFARALAIREKAPGPAQRDLASSLNNLAGLYQLKGDYDQAEPLFVRALALREQAQPDSLATAESLNNLALLYKQKKDYDRAEPLYVRSLAIREQRLKAGHPDIATALGNLAQLYLEKNQPGRAEELFRRALSINERAFGTGHYLYAGSLSSLASLYFLKGDAQQSQTLHRRALQIFERTLGPQHPLSCLSRNNLAQILDVNGSRAEAAALLTRNNEIREKNLLPIISIGSEREKLAYMATLAEETDFTVSLQTRSLPASLPALRLAITTILRRKGRVIDVMADSLSALRRRANDEDRRLLEQLFATRAQLASLMLKGPETASPAEHRARLARLEAEVQRLEALVSARSAPFRAQAQPVTFESVRRALPAAAALIEFVRYRPFNRSPQTTGETFGEPHYVAYVVPKLGRPAWVELGDAAAIDRQVDQLRQALREPQRREVKQLARAVDEKVMQPIRKRLGPIRTILVSPDGALNLIPFAALVDERGRYLVERYAFTYLTSGRDLLRMQSRVTRAQAPVILANPDFGEEAAAESERKLTVGTGKSEAAGIIDFSDIYFDPLPATAEEAQALGQILSGAITLTGERATEAALKQVRAPEVLHVATHGFFLEEAVSPASADRRGLRLKSAGGSNAGAPSRRIDNPLLRSGLALAGANRRQSGEGEDGILTALEAAALDLWGTHLVVLSACDTAVGEVKSGDGVYGLRRALLIAGAESGVMSLWPVNDRGTRDLMIAYYQAMRAGQDQSEAMRKVQLRMLASQNYQHPYYWASFIHFGRWQRSKTQPANAN